ncbi:Copper-exporting P-type ATPase [bioreactor metagenome]|uniref:Copper-exporting P-type ATPase n=1 Tax=bioreactor metagenome TaxID=1076179 RepID=A0A644Y3S8_9ZZZZ
MQKEDLLRQIRQRWLFILPIFLLGSLLLSLAFEFLWKRVELAHFLSLAAILIGSWRLLRESIAALLRRNFALDYIALLAITTGVITGNYSVALVIVLMMVGGNTLEDYAAKRAATSLTQLKNRLPQEIQVLTPEGQISQKITQVPIGSEIVIRKGEVIPLDGLLLSKTAVIDESSLTGEALPVEKEAGDTLHSGTLNLGEVLTLKTTVENQDSNYQKIINLVEEAQSGKAPFLQLADKLSMFFTLFTLLLAGLVFFFTHSLERTFAVLVIATPCPLILATPIAIMGGVNQAAKHLIIFRQLSALEILAEVKAMIFDKTGTITFGEMRINDIIVTNENYQKDRILQIALGLERNSLHPIARSLLHCCREKKLQALHFQNVKEIPGLGIEGNYRGDHYRLLKSNKKYARTLLKRNGKLIAYLDFIDQPKPSSSEVLESLQKLGIELHIFTGDKLQRAKDLLKSLPNGIQLQADCSPEEKRQGILQLKQQQKITAMIGDGINDAPALALADVGIAFSHQEQSAASEAADVVILGNSFQSVLAAVSISQRSMKIAKESMYAGLALSMLGMMVAAFGYLPALAGALLQEVIDVAVIFNALRSSQDKKA